MDKDYGQEYEEVDVVKRQQARPLPLEPVGAHRVTRLSPPGHGHYYNPNDYVHGNHHTHYSRSPNIVPLDAGGYYESVYNRTPRPPQATYHEDRIRRDHRPSMLMPRNTPGPNTPITPAMTRDPALAGQRINNMLVAANDRAQKINFMISDQEKLAMKQVKNIASDTRRKLSLVALSLNDAVKTKGGREGKVEPARSSSKHLVLAVSVFFASFLGFYAYDPVVDFGIDSIFQLNPSSIFKWAWSYNPIPIFGDFYMFNLENPEEFLRGARPELKEVGPFSYHLYRRRKVIGFTQDKVEFYESYEMYHSPTTSLPLDTQVRMINFPIFGAIVIAQMLLKMLYISFTKPIVYNVMVAALRASGEEYIEERPAHEIFVGRKIDILNGLESMLLQPLRDRGIPIPELGLGKFKIRNATFGFAALIQNVEFGPYEVWRRTENGHIASQFVTYKGKTTLPNFRSPCNRLHGSEGILWGRHVNSKRLVLYNHLACRTLTVVFKGVEYYNGIRTYRYEPDENLFNSSHPRYKCYCFEGDARYCDGWSNGAGCYEGLSVAISFPQFDRAPFRQRAIRGFKDNPRRRGHLNIEPNLGVPLNANVMVQGSLLLDDISWVPGLASIRPLMYPVFIVNLHLGASAVQSAAALVGINLLVYGSYGVLAGGLAGSGYLFFKAAKTRSRHTKVG